jgi:hypothetical protein
VAVGVGQEHGRRIISGLIWRKLILSRRNG